MILAVLCSRKYGNNQNFGLFLVFLRNRKNYLRFVSNASSVRPASEGYWAGEYNGKQRQDGGLTEVTFCLNGRINKTNNQWQLRAIMGAISPQSAK